MTLHNISSTIAQCDGTVEAACHPHQCAATIPVPAPGSILATLADAGWSMVGAEDGVHHFCPDHPAEDDAGPCCLGSARGSDHDPDCYARP